MNAPPQERLRQRLNQILPKITADPFLRSQGIGNEIAFHIFDYPPEHELQVREHVDCLLRKEIPQRKPDLKVAHVNLFTFLLEYLESRKLLEKSLKLQRDKGNQSLLKALKGVLHEEKIAKRFGDSVKPQEQDLVLVSGIGSAYPMLRPHTLLSNLQSVMGQTPLVMFYPGSYDGTTFRLFDKTGLAGDRQRSVKYYRAFRLID
jgi:hypothetical protein